MHGKIKHICLADDDRDDYEVFLSTLNEIDEAVQLTWIDNCEKVLTFLETGTDLPDILLLDLNMPGLSGEECLLKIKSNSRLRNIHTVIFSTSSGPLTMAKALKLGASKYIVKPDTYRELQQIIRELVTMPLS